MSKVVTTTVLPDVAGGSVTLGGTGDSVVATGNDIRTNTLQDAGGNAVFTSDGSGVLSGMNSGLVGAMKLLATTTVGSPVANISFTTQLTSTYDVYIFSFIQLHPATDGQELKFQVNASGQTGFNETMTTTFFDADHTEANAHSIQYEAADDQAQGTGYQKLARGVGNENDECVSGTLHLFAPADTTHCTQFYARTSEYMSSPRILDNFIGGYINTAAAITQIDFKFNSGNIDSGTIKLYGMSKS